MIKCHPAPEECCASNVEHFSLDPRVSQEATRWSIEYDFECIWHLEFEVGLGLTEGTACESSPVEATTAEPNQRIKGTTLGAEQRAETADNQKHEIGTEATQKAIGTHPKALLNYDSVDTETKDSDSADFESDFEPSVAHAPEAVKVKLRLADLVSCSSQDVFQETAGRRARATPEARFNEVHDKPSDAYSLEAVKMEGDPDTRDIRDLDAEIHGKMGLLVDQSPPADRGAALRIGARVRLIGLSQTQFNGREAIVVAQDGTTGRWSVSGASQRSAISVKPMNLEIIDNTNDKEALLRSFGDRALQLGMGLRSAMFTFDTTYAYTAAMAEGVTRFFEEMAMFDDGTFLNASSRFGGEGIDSEIHSDLAEDKLACTTQGSDNYKGADFEMLSGFAVDEPVRTARGLSNNAEQGLGCEVNSGFAENELVRKARGSNTIVHQPPLLDKDSGLCLFAGADATSIPAAPVRRQRGERRGKKNKGKTQRAAANMCGRPGICRGRARAPMECCRVSCVGSLCKVYDEGALLASPSPA